MADEWLGRAINDYLTERGIKQIFLSQKTGILLQRILFDAIICRIRKIKISHF